MRCGRLVCNSPPTTKMRVRTFYRVQIALSTCDEQAFPPLSLMDRTIDHDSGALFELRPAEPFRTLLMVLLWLELGQPRRKFNLYVSRATLAEATLAQAANSASNAFASLRSRVPNPSVTSHRLEREARELHPAYPDRARAAPCSSLRGVPRTSPLADAQQPVRARNIFALRQRPAPAI